VTFPDDMTAVRKWLWAEYVFQAAGPRDTFAKLPRGFQKLVLNGLARRRESNHLPQVENG
jgi:hypothetical protein